MKLFISIALTAIFILLDLLAGNLGIFPALTVYCSMVLLLAYGWKYGIASALAGGVIIDAVFGHLLAYYGLFFILAGISGCSIAFRGHRQLAGIFTGGCIAGLIVSALTALLCHIPGYTLPGPDAASYIIFSTGGGGIFLVLLVIVFDFFAVRANLPRCVKSSFNESGSRKNAAMRSRMKSSSRRRR